MAAGLERTLAPLLASAPHLAGPLRLAAAYGTPTSAWRSAQHNRRVGGVPNSYHLTGNAIDVQRRAGVTHGMLDSALRRASYVLIESLDEGDHSHFAILAGAATAKKPVTAASPVVPTNKVAWTPRVAADEHGTLLIDAGRLDAIAGPAAGAPPRLPALASAK